MSADCTSRHREMFSLLLSSSRSGAFGPLAFTWSLGTDETPPGMLSDLRKAPTSAPCHISVSSIGPVRTYIATQGTLAIVQPLYKRRDLTVQL